MGDRREFLAMGLAAAALPVSARAWLSTNAAAAPPSIAVVPIYKVVYDARYPAGRAFARHARDLGARVAGIHGDITSLWYDDLDLRWSAGAAAIAGLTDTRTLFCLEQLAWSAARMRMVFRADHKGLSESSLEQAPAGQPGGSCELDTLRDPGLDWTRSVAALVMRYPEHLDAGTRVLNIAPLASSADDLHLVSWVIAPIDRS